MISLYQELILISPLLIAILSIFMMILVSCFTFKKKYIHYIHALIMFFCIIFSLIFLIFIHKKTSLEINLLIRLDNFSILCIIIVLITNLVNVILVHHWLIHNLNKYKEFYILMLISMTGAVLTIYSSHFVTLFLGIELLSIPLFGMIGYNHREKNSLEASIKYTILSIIASSFLLFGIALIYTSIGKLSFYEINQIFYKNKLLDPIVILGFGMIIAGLGFKMSLVPFHLWTPDIYQVSPIPVIIMLAVTNKIAIFTSMMKLYLCFYNDNTIIKILLIIVSVFSMLFGNIMALNQNNIKRILGCSSISHMGYLLLTLITSCNFKTRLEAISVYLVSYSLTNLSTLGTMSLVSDYLVSKKIEYKDSIYFYRGLFKYKKLLSLTLTISILSLTGIPMTIGFISKFYIILLSLSSNLNWIVVVLVTSSIIGLIYYLKIIVNLYLNPNIEIVNFKEDNTNLFIINKYELLVTVISIFVLVLGLFPQILIFITKLLIY